VEGKSLALTIAEYADVILDLFERYGITAGINELRDAVSQADGAGEEAHKHLEQADENIYNALAGAVAGIDEEIQDYDKSLRFANLNEHFGNYQRLSGALTRLTRQIENARQSREQRDALYRDMAEGADFKAALNYLDELRGSIGAIGQSVDRNNIRRWFSVSATTLLISIALFAAITNAIG